MSHGFGLRKDTKSVLDYNGEFRCSASDIELPSKFMLDKQYIPDCRDQGCVGSCVGFAITNIMQILNYKETGKRDRFSAGYVYGKCRDKDDVYTGMFIRKTLDYLIKTGACFEIDFSRNEEMPLIRELIDAQPELDEKAYPYRIRGYEIYNKADRKAKLNSIKNALITYNTPILVSTDMYREPHAVCIIGWSDKLQQYYIMNSWGEYVGDKGICKIDYNSIDWGYLLLDEKNSNALMPFEDVSEDKWYYKAIEKAYNAGFINGTSESTFDPENSLKRAEAAQMLVNYANKMQETVEDMIDKRVEEKVKEILNNLGIA